MKMKINTQSKNLDFKKMNGKNKKQRQRKKWSKTTHTHSERERVKMMRNIKAARKIQKKRKVKINPPTTMSSVCVCVRAQRKWLIFIMKFYLNKTMNGNNNNNSSMHETKKRTVQRQWEERHNEQVRQRATERSNLRLTSTTTNPNDDGIFCAPFLYIGPKKTIRTSKRTHTHAHAPDLRTHTSRVVVRTQPD